MVNYYRTRPSKAPKSNQIFIKHAGVDTIGHGVLLEKLVLYGVSGHEHERF